MMPVLPGNSPAIDHNQFPRLFNGGPPAYSHGYGDVFNQ